MTYKNSWQKWFTKYGLKDFSSQIGNFKQFTIKHGEVGNVSYSHGLHPGLVPGVSVDDRNLEYKLDKRAIIFSGALILGFIFWGLFSTDSLVSVSDSALKWTVNNAGWIFSILAVAVLLFMLFVAFSKYGNIPLGLDDEKPEYSFFSWVAMLFSAGMGIGLLFFGAYEPLTYLIQPSPMSKVSPGSYEALNASMAQTMLHWGFNAWAFYALVGAAIGYGSFRRGRVPLMSKIFSPLLGDKTDGLFGRMIDMLAIFATLFGTAASLGIGATQIAKGTQLVSGIGPVGNAGLITIIAVLTACFIFSAVSGVSKGIRLLSNINMTVAFLLFLFVFLAGPTVFILNLIPSSFVNYLSQAPYLLSASASWGPAVSAFVDNWTVFYWAWWISWSPFVGMFIARISRGRTLREFITVVLVVPTTVCLLAFSILGGTSMKMQLDGADLVTGIGSNELLFKVLDELPFGTITGAVAMVCILIFFVTSADSASVVMGSLSQQGNPNPNKMITAFWGLCLSGIAIVGLLVGKSSAIQGLQNLIIVTALPFAFVILGIIISFWKDLSTDPYSIRATYAQMAIEQAVRQGIEEHGDDFALSIEPTEQGQGVGADFDSQASELTDWYESDDVGQAIKEGVERVASQE